MWQPADGSEPISEAEYYAQAEAEAAAESVDADTEEGATGVDRTDEDAEDAADDSVGARDEEE